MKRKRFERLLNKKIPTIIENTEFVTAVYNKDEEAWTVSLCVSAEIPDEISKPKKGFVSDFKNEDTLAFVSKEKDRIFTTLKDNFNSKIEALDGENLYDGFLLTIPPSSLLRKLEYDTENKKFLLPKIVIDIELLERLKDEIEYAEELMKEGVYEFTGEDSDTASEGNLVFSGFRVAKYEGLVVTVEFKIPNSALESRIFVA